MAVTTTVRDGSHTCRRGLAEELGSVKKAFTAHTGLPAVHVIHYDKHERYDLNGKLLEDK